MGNLDEKEKAMLHEIHSAVIGNDSLGHEGLVKQVKRHEAWIAKADLKFASVMGGAGVIVFLIEILFKK